jgi:hypothetical protein
MDLLSFARMSIKEKRDSYTARHHGAEGTTNKHTVDTFQRQQPPHKKSQPD